jgi:hypothetical protein
MRRFALIALLTACTVDDPVEPPEPAEAAEPTKAAEPAEAPERPERPQLSPDVTPVQDLTDALQRLGQLMTEMREAIREAGENAEGDDCAKARAIFLASNEALRTSLEEEPLPGGRTPPFWEVAEPGEFARRCHELPETVQRCLRLDVRAEDRETCGPAMAGLDEDQQAIVDAIAKSVREDG